MAILQRKMYHVAQKITKRWWLDGVLALIRSEPAPFVQNIRLRSWPSQQQPDLRWPGPVLVLDRHTSAPDSHTSLTVTPSDPQSQGCRFQYMMRCHPAEPEPLPPSLGWRGPPLRGPAKYPAGRHVFKLVLSLHVLRYGTKPNYGRSRYVHVHVYIASRPLRGPGCIDLAGMHTVGGGRRHVSDRPHVSDNKGTCKGFAFRATQREGDEARSMTQHNAQAEGAH
jgi:hypothetical protein